MNHQKTCDARGERVRGERVRGERVRGREKRAATDGRCDRDKEREEQAISAGSKHKAEQESWP